MSFSRREWMALTALSALAPFGSPRRVVAQTAQTDSLTRRISNVIRDYEIQGFHRTGTAVDQASADWLSDLVQQIGLTPMQESFSLSRIDPVMNALTVGERRIEGVPLFDGTFTDASGIRARLGGLDSDADIGLTDTAVNASAMGSLGDARRANRHKAIVAITRGRRPGLCPSNADSFLRPFGPPVLQVTSEEANWLGEVAKRGAEVRLVAHVVRTSSTAKNVTASLQGTDSTLAPLVVMTPRSGWYSCASERGGGIASWLEIMRGLRATRLRRSVLFVASSGHELGHLGIDAFIERRPRIVKDSVGWLHLGASIGAATDLGNNLLQASDDELDTMLTSAMTAVGLGIARRAARGTVPAGEAEAVHRGGGRYVSAIGGNALFHNPNDRGPLAVDPISIAKFSAAFIAVVRSMAGAA
jgi:hypothetical protein